MLYYIKALNYIQSIKDSRDGATAIEYGLLAGLIAVAIVAALTLLGPKLAAVFTSVTTSLPAAS